MLSIRLYSFLKKKKKIIRLYSITFFFFWLINISFKFSTGGKKKEKKKKRILDQVKPRKILPSPNVLYLNDVVFLLAGGVVCYPSLISRSIFLILVI